MATGGIFLLQDNETLIELADEQYASESLLQDLLARYPDLLAGDQMNPDVPRRWLLISREASVPDAPGAGGRWSVDHLFLDQDGIPTIVEVKRSTDSRIRREVVGQILDYAANAILHWPLETIQGQYQASCALQGVDPEQRLAEFLGPEIDPEPFWSEVMTNLQRGRIRLLFAADVIPTELRRVVEFLNTQMNPAEVLALEIKQYVGQGLKTLVPRIIGQSATTQRNKTGGIREVKHWDEALFFQSLAERKGEEIANVGRALLKWAMERELRLWWGKGKSDGSMFPLLDVQGRHNFLFSVWTYGRIEIQFQWMKSRPSFADEGKRLELLRRLNVIPGVPPLPPDAISRRPTFPLESLKNERSLQQFLETFDWVIQQIESSA